MSIDVKAYRLTDAAGRVLGDFGSSVAAKLHIPEASYWVGDSNHPGNYDGWALSGKSASPSGLPQYQIHVIGR